MKPRILLLSGGSLVGQNILAALGARRAATTLFCTNSDARAPGLSAFDAVYLVPELRADEPAFRQRFEEVLERCQPQLVLPCRDDDVAWLAREKAAGHPLGATFLCGAADLAEGMLDKAASQLMSGRLGLPYVATLPLATASVRDLQDFAASHGFPLLVKPRQGFASRGVSILMEPGQLAYWAQRADCVLQKYLGPAEALARWCSELQTQGIPLFHSFEGDKLSLQSYISPAGRVLGSFATINTMREGKSGRIERCTAPDALALARRAGENFARHGWIGPLNLQCKRDADGTLQIFEYNGRYTGATAARGLLGYDELGFALEGLGLPVVAAADAAQYREVQKLSTNVPLDGRFVDALQNAGQWQALEPASDGENR